MLKIRYYRLRLPSDTSLPVLESAARQSRSSGLNVVRTSSEEIFLQYTTIKLIETLNILEDGSEVRATIPTMDKLSIRLLSRDNHFILAILDPPRGQRAASEVLFLLFKEQAFFLDALDITQNLVQRHIKRFDNARLVSAKVRDFRVSENSIGRLEITSKEGLDETIAPFIKGKYYKIDSLTYEITHKLQRGLINYSSNGTIRVSEPLVEIAFPIFEKLIFNE